MKVTDDGLAFISHEEGCLLAPYLDIGGKLTIGVGHLVQPGEKFARITEDDAEALLRRDVIRFEEAVTNYVRVPLTFYQFDALVSFAFNEGAGAFARSTLVSRLNSGEHEAVPEELKRWCKYSTDGGKTMKESGTLKARRIREGILFSVGDYGESKKP